MPSSRLKWWYHLESLSYRQGLCYNELVSKDQLADRLYGVSDEVGPNAIEVFVHRLRRKIEAAGVSIRTIRGLGYLVEKPGHPHAAATEA